MTYHRHSGVKRYTTPIQKNKLKPVRISNHKNIMNKSFETQSMDLEPFSYKEKWDGLYRKISLSCQITTRKQKKYHFHVKLLLAYRKISLSCQITTRNLPL